MMLSKSGGDANMKNFQNEIFNLGTGVKTEVSKIIDYIEELVPNSSHYVTEPTPGDQTGIYADVRRLNEQISTNLPH